MSEVKKGSKGFLHKSQITFLRHQYDADSLYAHCTDQLTGHIFAYTEGKHGEPVH